MPIYLTALGTVTAYNTVTIKTRVDGQLIQVPVREGQAVRRANCWRRSIQLRTRRPWRRPRTAVKDQATAANAGRRRSGTRLCSGRGGLEGEPADAGERVRDRAAGAIAADKAAIQAAKVNLAYTKILSPIDGVVGLRQVDPGNIVHASDATGSAGGDAAAADRGYLYFA